MPEQQQKLILYIGFSTPEAGRVYYLKKLCLTLIRLGLMANFWSHGGRNFRFIFIFHVIYPFQIFAGNMSCIWMPERFMQSLNKFWIVKWSGNCKNRHLRILATLVGIKNGYKYKTFAEIGTLHNLCNSCLHQMNADSENRKRQTVKGTQDIPVYSIIVM